MLKEILQDIILFNQQTITGLTVYPRDMKLDVKANHVIVGARRAGKTYLLYQFIIKYLNSDEDVKKILFINFEDDRLIEFKHTDFQLVLDAYHELFPEKPIIFLDEIQNINYWEKFARRLVDTGYQVFITGSNARMLSKEIGTTLGGRFLITEILPLSFSEYLTFNNITIDTTALLGPDKFRVKRLFQEYFTYGGFPELLNYADKRSYLSNLFQKLFYSDIIVRNSLKNDKALHILVKKMAESVNNETSVTRIKNLIKSIGFPVGTATVINYLQYLNDSYLLFPVINYANKLVERETVKKYYFLDNGLLSLFIHNQETKLLENMVYLFLKKRFEQIYFYKRKYEVDFYIPEKELLIQVCYDISQIETQQRELTALKKINNELNAKDIQIISYDTETELHLDNEIIKVIPVWKWLINSSNYL